MEKIKQTGRITVLTRNNGHCYYTYRDKPLGFEYELAKAFANHLGVKLMVRTPSWEGLIPELVDGKGDFIAASITITPEREEQVDFSDGYITVQQQVIVHKNNRRIRTISDLDGETVNVRKGTSYEKRLNELREEGLNIRIRLHDDVPTEEFIRQVAVGEIDVTIADSNIALLNRRYFPDVRIAFPIEEPEAIGWAVKKDEDTLLAAINDFFEKIEANGTYAKIFEKYFANVEIFDYVDLRKYHKRLRTHLPRYESLIREASAKHGFDWRLIAAMIYQESHFNSRARSYTGVLGLMQLTLTTAREMGIKNRLDPAQNIRGGVRYLRKIYDRYSEIEPPDRIRIALASYNVGAGHIFDAQKLAEKKGLDPRSWSSLRETLPMLRFAKYYKKSKYGYCRGTEPVRYVKRIMTYYDILKREAVRRSAESRTRALPKKGSVKTP